MKKIIITLAVIAGLLSTGLVLNAGMRGYQAVDIYVCDSSIISAEMRAKSKVSRQDLYVAGYCSCMGFDNELKSEVRDDPCDPPRDSVFLCTCFGKSSY